MADLKDHRKFHVPVPHFLKNMHLHPDSSRLVVHLFSFRACMGLCRTSSGCDARFPRCMTSFGLERMVPDSEISGFNDREINFDSTLLVCAFITTFYLLPFTSHFRSSTIMAGFVLGTGSGILASAAVYYTLSTSLHRETADVQNQYVLLSLLFHPPPPSPLWSDYITSNPLHLRHTLRVARS